jgi:transposase
MNKWDAREHDGVSLYLAKSYRKIVMTTTIGIDVSKVTLDVMIVQEQTRQHRQFANSSKGHQQLHGWLQKHQVEHAPVCLEATGRYGQAITRFRYDQAFSVSVVNPRRIKAYGESLLQRNKTDKSDAWLIADFCRTQQPRLWQPPDPATDTLQAWQRRLDDLQQMRTQERNRLEGLPQTDVVYRAIRRHLRTLEREIGKVEQAIAAYIQTAPSIQQAHALLTSIVGIGDKSAGQILAELPDIHAFDNAAELAAYAGVSPRQKRSGSSVRGRSRLVKIGSAKLRKALFFPALAAMRFNPHLKVVAARLLAAGKPKMVVVGAIMRKLLCLIYAILKSGRPYDPNYRFSA